MRSLTPDMKWSLAVLPRHFLMQTRLSSGPCRFSLREGLATSEQCELPMLIISPVVVPMSIRLQRLAGSEFRRSRIKVDEIAGYTWSLTDAQDSLAIRLSGKRSLPDRQRATWRPVRKDSSGGWSFALMPGKTVLYPTRPGCRC